jgi:hypothetical protein
VGGWIDSTLVRPAQRNGTDPQPNELAWLRCDVRNPRGVHDSANKSAIMSLPLRLPVEGLDLACCRADLLEFLDENNLRREVRNRLEGRGV